MTRLIALTAAAWIASGCGDSTMAPTRDATITITSGGISPKEVRLEAWNQVVFVNNDTQPHNIVSDPVNEHTQCPAINSVGYLPPGARRQTLTLIDGPAGFTTT
jgi:hypothetical protein